MLRTKIVICILLGFCVSISSSWATATEQKEFDFEMVTKHEKLEAREKGENIFQDLEPDFDKLSEEVSEKEIIKIAKRFGEKYRAEQKIINEMVMMPDTDDVDLHSGITVPLGTDWVFGMNLPTSDGNFGGWGLVGNSSYNFNQGHSLKTDSHASGTGGRWAWAVLDQRFTVSGTGYQTARISFGPFVYWQRLEGDIAGWAEVSIRLEIWRVSGPTEVIANNIVLDETRDFVGSVEFSDNSFRNIYAQLHGGQTYVIRIVQEGWCEVFGGQAD